MSTVIPKWYVFDTDTNIIKTEKMLIIRAWHGIHSS
jgi:hypothetical protein